MQATSHIGAPAMTRAEFQKLLEKPSVKFILNHTFFAQLFYSIDTIEDNTQPTAWTNGTKRGVNSSFFKGLSPELQIAVLAHETLHDALEHVWRRGSRDPKKWNIACDFEVNALLLENNFQVDKTWIQPRDEFKGLPAEQIYDLLPDQGDQGDGGAPGGMGFDLRDCPGTEQERTVARNHIQAAVVAAARVAEKSQGDMPEFAKRMLDKIANPPTPWHELLREFITKLKFDDFSWDRVDRIGFAKTGCIMPRMYNETLGEIVVFYDTSGSIGGPELSEFQAHANIILYDGKPSKLWVVPIDARVHDDGVQEIEPYQFPFEFTAYGGGGTDFRPAFDWIQEKGIEPECVIYLTDMCGSFPDVPPPYPVMWVSNSNIQEAPFGTVVDIRVR